MNPASSKAIAARRKVLENPFNACHQVDGATPPWAYRSASEIRSELKRRGLSDEGGKKACVKRLKEHNEHILTPTGSLEIHHQKLTHLHTHSLSTLVPFPLFPKIPPELRLIIWAFSLPGPRILAASCGNRRNGLFNFFSKNNPCNPTLLSVNRESRDLAMRYYRLCFGMSNIYADLSIDILYFGAGWSHQVLGHSYNACVFDTWSKKLNRRVPAKMKDEVIADCKEIKHVAMLSNLWRSRSHFNLISTGADLRGDAKEAFPGLRQLSIVVPPEGESFGTPGYIEFVECERKAEVRLANGFMTCGLSEEEKAGGVSEVQVVSAFSTPHVPGDDWEREYGEPFYPPELASPPTRRSNRLSMAKGTADSKSCSCGSCSSSDKRASRLGFGFSRKCHA